MAGRPADRSGAGLDVTGLDNVRLAGVNVSAVPEPSSLALVAMGGLWLAARRRVRR